MTVKTDQLNEVEQTYLSPQLFSLSYDGGGKQTVMLEKSTTIGAAIRLIF